MTCFRCEELERLPGLREEFPPALHLSKTMKQMLGMLLKREFVTSEALYTAVWGNKPDSDMPGSNIVSVYISKLRATLKPFGIEISTRWSQGYYFTAENKQKLRALCDMRRAA